MSAPIKTFAQWLPALCLAAAIFYFSSQPAAPRVSGDDGIQLHLQKVGHLTEYALLATLIHRALRRGHNLSARRAALLAAFLAGGYAVTDEIHQAFVPSRFCTVSDMAIDTLGGVLAVTALYAHDTRRSQTPTR